MRLVRHSFGSVFHGASRELKWSREYSPWMYMAPSHGVASWTEEEKWFLMNVSIHLFLCFLAVDAMWLPASYSDNYANDWMLKLWCSSFKPNSSTPDPTKWSKPIVSYILSVGYFISVMRKVLEVCPKEKQCDPGESLDLWGWFARRVGKS